MEEEGKEEKEEEEKEEVEEGASEAASSKSAANGQTVTASSWPRVTIRVRETKTRKRVTVTTSHALSHSFREVAGIAIVELSQLSDLSQSLL